MASGYKTGGRTKGTLNHDKKQLAEMLAEKYPGYHPVMALVEIANDLKNDVHIRLQAHKEIAKYLYPRLKAVEISSDYDQQAIIRVTNRIIPAPEK